MNKKGLSHIEFVVSFVIFIGFIVFAFVFFNPLQSQRTLKSTMDYAWIEVSQEGREDIETYSISIVSPITPLELKVRIDGVPLNYNASVEDIDGTPIPTHRDSAGIVYFTRQTNNDKFFRIKYSESLTDSGPILPGASDLSSHYAISSSEVEEIYSEKLFFDLNQSYYSDYSGLKQRLNLPNRMEFGFVVTLSDKQINAVNQIPEGIEILSKNDRIEIVRNSGEREYADLRVLVW